MYWYELLFLWTQCYVILTVLSVCTSIGWIIFSHSYLHVTHDEISVCLAIWLIWWTNIFVIKMINTPGHVLSPGWPLCKRSGLTLIEVSQHAYSSYQAFSLPFIFYHVILATWCNWLDFYWCWIKFNMGRWMRSTDWPCIHCFSGSYKNSNSLGHFSRDIINMHFQFSFLSELARFHFREYFIINFSYHICKSCFISCETHAHHMCVCVFVGSIE